MKRHRHEAKQSPRVTSRVADRRLPSVAMPSWVSGPKPARADEVLHPSEVSTALPTNDASHGLRSQEIDVSPADRGEFPRYKADARSWRLPLCLLLSIFAHGAAFSYVLIQFNQSIGSGGQSLEAISVEIVDAVALESVEVNPAVQASGAAQSVSSRVGAEAPVDQVEVQQQTESNKALPSAMEEALVRPDNQASPEAELRAAENVTDNQNLVVAEREAPPTPQDQRRAEDVEQVEEEGRAKVRQEAQDAQMAGQTASRSLEASEAGLAAAQATKGQAAQYAMLVRATLGTAHPTHLGKRGRVIVKFVIDKAGAVSSAIVTASSGNADLDEATLSSLRKTSFPKPPREMSESQRQFMVPFDFK